MTINLITKKNVNFFLILIKNTCINAAKTRLRKNKQDKRYYKAKIKEIEASLLGKSIVGFRSFQNFKLSTKK
jgi:hypothetical protein